MASSRSSTPPAGSAGARSLKPNPVPTSEKRPAPWLPVVFLGFAMFMATGPGVVLVNRPESFLGLPLIYAWSIFWFFVIGGIAIWTDRTFWSHERTDEEDSGHGA